MIAAIIQAPERLSPFVDPAPHAHPAQLRAAAHGRGALPHRGRGARGTRTGRSSCADSRHRSDRSRRTSSRTSARGSSRNTAPRRSTKRGCGSRRRSMPSCRKRPTRHRPRPAPRRQAARRLPQAGPQHPQRGVDARAFHHRPLDTSDSRWRHRPGAGRRRADRRRRGQRAPPYRRQRDRAAAQCVRLDPAHRSSGPDQAGRSRRSGSSYSRRKPAGRGGARAATARRRRAARDRQPHRPDPRDGRRFQFRPQQVQSRDAGAPPGRLAVQAVRLHRRHRPRFHAGLGVHRRTGVLQRRRRPAALPAGQLRPQVRGCGDTAARARGLAQHSGGEGDGRSRAAAGRRVREALRAARRLPAVPVARAGRGRVDAGRHDERLFRLPEPGRSDAALLGGDDRRPRG